MSKTKRKTSSTPNESLDENKSLNDVSENLTQITKEIKILQEKYDKLDDQLKDKNKNPSTNNEEKTASSDTRIDVINLQKKYEELFNNVKTLNNKITLTEISDRDKMSKIQQTGENNEVFKKIQKDIASFVIYGKLFLGIGIAALLLYIITAIINLATIFRTPIN
jgi:predicted nuclease with TOPRIM domain